MSHAIRHRKVVTQQQRAGQTAVAAIGGGAVTKIGLGGGLALKVGLGGAVAGSLGIGLLGGALAGLMYFGHNLKMRRRSYGIRGSLAV